MMNHTEDKIKSRIEKLLFSAIFTVGFLCGFAFLTPFISDFSLEKNIVTAVPDFASRTLGENTKRKEVIGFLPYWSVANKSPVYPQNLTQLVYFNLETDSAGNLLTTDKNGRLNPEWSYFYNDYFKDLSRQAKSSGVKILVAVNNFEADSIDKLIRRKSAVDNFILQLSALVAENDIDGINIDFEYPTDENIPDAYYFGKFLGRIKESLSEINPAFILSVDLMANAIIKNPDFDLSLIEKNVDQIIMMTYDYHHFGSETAGPVSPLYGGINERNVNEVISFVRGKVADEKVVMGIPFYGYEWETETSSYKSRVKTDTSTAIASYSRMRELTKNKDLKVYWNDIAKSPWLAYWDQGERQIYFEDDRSLSHKLNYVIKNNLGGIAIWALGYEGKYREPWDIITKYL